MLNTRELEKRWLKYKIKTYIPHAIIFVSIIVIMTIISIFATSNTEKTPVIATKTEKHEKRKIVAIQSLQKEQNVSTQKEIVTAPVQTNIQQNTQVQTTTLTEDTKLTLSPSMNFMRRIQNEEQQPYYKVTSSVKKSTKKRKKVVQQATVEEEYMDIEQKSQVKKKTTNKAPITIVKKEPTSKPYKKQIITIERRDSQNDIKEIITRFKKNNNPALSLFVAKKYYELGNYEQAYNYALITNAINNDIEDSWLIFAKSLVKLNKRDMAIKTLKEYIKYSHSGNAKILLNDIQSGKFK
ncbi:MULTISPECIES: hypothetical protein [Sulfurimonas]|uniref:tetratricopeptide repeat protein n=1 Tax=Sulfurimonas TaxID=202746 RepID=UPI0012649B55|nr:hypothetical protein [Sulfurimonas indica]